MLLLKIFSDIFYYCQHRIPDDNVFFELSIKFIKSRKLSQNGVYFLQILVCKVTHAFSCGPNFMKRLNKSSVWILLLLKIYNYYCSLV